MSSASILVSIIYNWAYFHVIGLSLFEVMTISDQIEGVAIWTVPVVGFFSIGFFADLFFRRVERGMTEEQLIATSPTPRFTRWFRKSHDVAVWALAGLLVFSGLISSPNEDWLPYSYLFLFIWFPLISFIFSIPQLQSGYSEFARMLIFFLPPLAALSLGQGSHAAVKDLMTTEPNAVVTSITGDNEANALILRYIEKGLIYRITKENVVVFVPWQHVRSVHQKIESPLKSRLCIWFGVVCGETKLPKLKN